MDAQLTLTPTTKTRVLEQRERLGSPEVRLRLTVEGGGCSGFQYILEWDDKVNADDYLFEDVIVTDEVSIPYLHGATIDYVSDLMGEDFKILNPNAKSGCGCGTSFAV